jgi:hypothetical protein
MKQYQEYQLSFLSGLTADLRAQEFKNSLCVLYFNRLSSLAESDIARS